MFLAVALSTLYACQTPSSGSGSSSSDPLDDYDLQVRVSSWGYSYSGRQIRIVDGLLNYSADWTSPQDSGAWPRERPLTNAERALIQDRLERLDIDSLEVDPPRTYADEGLSLSEVLIHTRAPNGDRRAIRGRETPIPRWRPMARLLGAMGPSGPLESPARRLFREDLDGWPVLEPAPPSPTDAVVANIRPAALGGVARIAISPVQVELRFLPDGAEEELVLHHGPTDPLVWDLVLERVETLEPQLEALLDRRESTADPTRRNPFARVELTTPDGRAADWEWDTAYGSRRTRTAEADRRMLLLLNALAIALPAPPEPTYR